MLCLIFDKCTRELEVDTLTLNFIYFSFFFLFQHILPHNQNTILSTDFCVYKIFSFDSNMF